MKLKIGDLIYRYVITKGVFTYKVYEVRETEDSVLYAIRCEMCADHEPCEVLIAKDDKQNRFKYVMMLNDDNFEQYYWHTSDSEEGEYYYTDKKSAMKYRYEKRIKDYKNKIEKLNSEIKQCNEVIAEANNLIENL